MKLSNNVERKLKLPGRNMKDAEKLQRGKLSNNVERKLKLPGRNMKDAEKLQRGNQKSEQN